MKNHVLVLLLCAGLFSCSKKDLIATSASPDLQTDTDTTVSTQAFSFKLDTISYAEADVVAPMRGLNTFYTYTNGVSVPLATGSGQSLDNDTRYLWAEFQQAEGVYNFSKLDADIKYCIDNGKKISFGVMSVCTQCTPAQYNGVGYPAYLHNRMQAESVKDNLVGGYWVPSWNSNSFLTAFEQLNTAIAKHLAETSYKGVLFKNVASHIDIRGFGNWGEWHTASAGRDNKNIPRATEASLKRILDSYLKSFPDYQLILISSAFAGESTPALAYYALTAKNNVGLLGWRYDHFGYTNRNYYPVELESNTWSYNGISIKILIMDRWKTNPILAEPLQNDVNHNGSNYGNGEAQTKLYHLSQISNGNLASSDAAAANNLRNSSKAAGYRVNFYGGSVTSSAELNGSMQVVSHWGNIGIAPAYENWDVWYELRDGNKMVWTGKSSFTPKLFLPGKKTVTDNFTTAITGTYSLYLIIKDPVGYRKPFVLANKNREADGSYKIADIKL